MENTKKNTSQSVIRRNRNTIHGMNLLNGVWFTNDVVLKHEEIKFYKNIFYCPNNVHSTPFTC